MRCPIEDAPCHIDDGQCPIQLIQISESEFLGF